MYNVTTSNSTKLFEVKRITANNRLSKKALAIVDAYNNNKRNSKLYLVFYKDVIFTDKYQLELALETLECDFVSEDKELVEMLTIASELACPCFFKPEDVYAI